MSLDIYGDQEELSKINSVPVTLNVEGQGASGTKTYNVSINKPTGVRHMSETTARPVNTALRMNRSFFLTLSAAPRNL